MIRRRTLMQAALAALLPKFAGATPAQLQALLTEMFGERPIRHGRVTLDIPPLVENGNAVPMTVAVEGQAAKLHVFNEKNPQPHIISVTFGAKSGRRSFATRIKLANSQQIIAIAEMPDGSLWRGEASVVVTVAACIEEVN